MNSDPNRPAPAPITGRGGFPNQGGPIDRTDHPRRAALPTQGARSHPSRARGPHRSARERDQVVGDREGRAPRSAQRPHAAR
nr:MAG TPA: hypothetical protein [Caudoviricetes sp.]